MQRKEKVPHLENSLARSGGNLLAMCFNYRVEREFEAIFILLTKQKQGNPWQNPIRKETQLQYQCAIYNTAFNSNILEIRIQR